MSYIDNNLIPGEQIIFRTKKTVLIFFLPLVWTFVAIFATSFLQNNPFIAKIAFAPLLITLGLWLYVALEYMTSEYAVTDKRVMMREGFFTRHANEMRLSAISQVNVDQSLIGQVLNYGTVAINAFGAFDVYPMISKPHQFQKVVNEQLDKIAR